MKIIKLDVNVVDETLYTILSVIAPINPAIWYFNA